VPPKQKKAVLKEAMGFPGDQVVELSELGNSFMPQEIKYKV